MTAPSRAVLLVLGVASCVGLLVSCAARRRSPPPVAPPVFEMNCASCHGEKGHGDGPAGRFLNPPPRDFSDAEWQASITDDRLRQTIRQGGAAMGLSPAMASHPDLGPEDIEELIRYIRSLSDA